MHPIRKDAFTLIELIMAVSILSIGIVLVLRSFLSSSGALNIISDRLAALEILEVKMAALHEQAASGTLKPINSNDEIILNHRKAIYSLQVNNLKLEDKDTEFNEVRMSLSWQEDNKSQDEQIATYLTNRKTAS